MGKKLKRPSRGAEVALEILLWHQRIYKFVVAASCRPGGSGKSHESLPFNNPARQNVSPDPARRAAHAAVRRIARVLGGRRRPRMGCHSAGILTPILRADGLRTFWPRWRGDFGGIAVLPVHGRAGSPAIRVLVSARKGSRAPFALLPGLMLNDETGKPTAAAEAVLPGAEALRLASD